MSSAKMHEVQRSRDSGGKREYQERKRGIKQEDVMEEGKAVKLQRRRQRDKEDSSG